MENNNVKRKKLILVIITLLCTIIFFRIAIYKENNFDKEKMILINCTVVDKYKSDDTAYKMWIKSSYDNKNKSIKLSEDEEKLYQIGETYQFYTLDYRSYHIDEESLVGANVTGGYYLLSLISCILFIICFYQYIRIKKTNN